VCPRDEIMVLRDRTLTELDRAHDYYSDTKIAWDIVRASARRSRAVSVKNIATGTETTQSDLVRKAPGYIAGQLTEATFQQFISIFESFIFDLLRIWLSAHPKSLAKKKFDCSFGEALDAPDKTAILALFIEREIVGIAYSKPSDWFSYVNEKVNLACPSPDEVDRFTEAKASRDVLVHNRGFANKLYEMRSGRQARYKDGERIDVPESYHRDVWSLIRKIVADMSAAALAKAP